MKVGLTWDVKVVLLDGTDDAKEFDRDKH
jgi:hypothetical protein